MAAKKPPKAKPRPGEAEGSPARVTVDHNAFTLICERYAETGAAIASCEDLGYNYNTVMSAIKMQRDLGDDSWRDLWQFSYDKFRESLDREVVRRGRDGTPTKWLVNKNTGQPVLDGNGKMIVTEVAFSDRLLELAAKSHSPERYRENYNAAALGLDPVDSFAQLSTKAKFAIRQIILDDLEEQRQLKAASEEVEEADYIAIEDQSGEAA